MEICTLLKEIERLKKENDICILAHSYQSREVCEAADFTGDSYALAVRAKSVENSTVLMCGVRFMAEMVKLLAPQKRVILSEPQAGCPMAQQFSPQDILELRRLHPNAAVAAYVNTTAALKAVSDVCVTSSCAVKVVGALSQKEVIFVPDVNLGSFVQKNCPDKSIILMQGGCPHHAAVTAQQAETARRLHPNALLLAHPECPRAVTDIADYTGSTAGIMDFARKSSAAEFIIATEGSIVSHLRFELPEKRFYPVSAGLICPDMRLTDLAQVELCCRGLAGEEIHIDPDIAAPALKSIEKMIEYGG